MVTYGNPTTTEGVCVCNIVNPQLCVLTFSYYGLKKKPCNVYLFHIFITSYPNTGVNSWPFGAIFRISSLLTNYPNKLKLVLHSSLWLHSTRLERLAIDKHLLDRPIRKLNKVSKIP
jgi:hypothetical protein